VENIVSWREKLRVYPEQKPLLIIVLLSAISDDTLEEEEMDIIVNVLARMNTF
jgi:hypothetical protein